MTDKWAEYKKRFCSCKDASRLNSCKGLLTCSLGKNHPERTHINFDDLKDFWNGRPKTPPVPMQVCPIYLFELSPDTLYYWVHRDDVRYRPFNWRLVL